MRKFISLRDVRVCDCCGHDIPVKAGVPTPLPKDLERKAFELGCILAEDEVAGVVETAAERTAKIQAAVEQVIARGNKEDFNNKGLPELAVLSEIVGSRVSGAERDAAWEKVKV